MIAAFWVAIVLFCLPLLSTLIIRSFYGAFINQLYLTHPLLPLAASFVPVLVLKTHKILILKFGKIFFCILFELSVSILMLGFSPNLEAVFHKQWLVILPLMFIASATGFFMKKIILPQKLRFYFFGTIGLGAIIDLILSLLGWCVPGLILCCGISLFFVFMQYAQARVLQGRLRKETFETSNLQNIVLNYGLIFSINLIGMMPTAHPMKLLLAFMFDDLAAKNVREIIKS